MIILSGIQPSGKLHIGNYLGAVRNWLTLQEDPTNACRFFLADWHSLTESYNPTTKAAQVRELAVELLALGVDPERVIFFRQSDIPEHLELAWYLTCITPVGELERMTQFKDKTAHGDAPSVGLFTYPVLMAADVLMYRTNSTDPVHVPVGHDQVQHLELTNDLARRFNNRFGATFPDVQPLLTSTARVMSLKDPTRKMSKSHGPDHCLFLDDTPEDVERKLRSAVTDTGGAIATYDYGMMPSGVRTLFEILEAFGMPDEVAHFLAQYADGTIQYSELKPAVAKAFAEYFAAFRETKKELLAQPSHIDAVLAQGAERARIITEATMRETRTRVGI
ncbi:tryptophan--tRNA ligase [Candidatus Uhrbacteria bacterium]|nr:tryptophan--tRNA ligase [Candidatus Uhrbacteria bacterium]